MDVSVAVAELRCETVYIVTVWVHCCMYWHILCWLGCVHGDRVGTLLYVLAYLVLAWLCTWWVHVVCIWWLYTGRTAAGWVGMVGQVFSRHRWKHWQDWVQVQEPERCRKCSTAVLLLLILLLLLLGYRTNTALSEWVLNLIGTSAHKSPFGAVTMDK